MCRTRPKRRGSTWHLVWCWLYYGSHDLYCRLARHEHLA